MEQKQKHIIALWLKRILGIFTIFIWGYVIIGIAQSPAPFAEQAPYCMGSTMLIFGILTGIFKGLEYWEGNR